MAVETLVAVHDFAVIDMALIALVIELRMLLGQRSGARGKEIALGMRLSKPKKGHQDHNGRKD